MTEAETSSTLKHRLRLHELAKYYQVAVSPNRARTGSSLREENAIAQPTTPRLAIDSHLTALAQLAAFRTGCQRAYISIIDHQAQHIIAEATQSISLVDRNAHNQEDGLILGVQSLPLHFGVCPNTLRVFLEESDLTLKDPTSQATKDFVMIADLRSELETREIPLVKQMPSAFRYYVEVPLRTRSGLLLGSICAIDSNPRQPELEHVSMLQEIAVLVVDHLELLRMKEDHRRAELLLSGLAHFIRGQDDMSAWSEETPGQHSIPLLLSTQPRLSVGSLASLPTSDRGQPHHEPIDLPSHSHTDDNTDISAKSTTETATIFSDDGAKVSSLSSLDTEVEIGFDSFPFDRQNSPTPSQPQSCRTSVDVRHTFSRASNLIRQAMDLDAAIFLEVPHNDRFKSTKKRGRKVSDPDVGHEPSFHASTSESVSMADSSDTSPNETRLQTRNEDTLCHRLGYATRLKSSLIGSTVAKPFLTLPAAILSRLAARYPQGRVFQFDAYGSISSGDDEHTIAATREAVAPSPQGRLSARLHSMFPEARSLIFLPLYDNDRQQIYAGFIGLSVSPTRSLQQHESTYVSAFVNSLMCEIMLLEALKTDKAKSDFISSTSHELRSPLHGILASSQLLTESSVRPTQMELVQMIDTCARTLLDTTDHLLDHAKINHFTQQQAQRQGPKSRSRHYSLVTSTDMLSMVEDTVTSIAAGSQQFWSDSSSRPEETTVVPIIFDISPQKLWRFDTEVGSWRRIIMNLVGNSLKFTQHGHIKVSLGIRRQSATRYMADLRIVDTGTGISEEYLKHRLYTPFAQENNLSVGTGLGLSLVRQIVSSLHGNMQISSEIGDGTTVSIEIPLKPSIGADIQQSWHGPDPDLLTVLKRQTFQFVGFETGPLLTEAPTGILSTRMGTLSAMKSSLSNILTEWLDCQVVTKKARIAIVEESFLQKNLGDFDQPGKSLIVVSLKGRRATISDQIQKAVYVHLSAPIGPTKLTNALRTLLYEQTPSISSIPEISFLSDQRRVSSASPNSQSPSRPPLKSSDSKEAILLVDDNNINLRILLTCIGKLNLADVDLLTACDGQEAVERYASAIEAGKRPSVVFMDISMPIMNGFQATRRIRSLEKAKGIARDSGAKIIALTGLASVDALDEVKASGFDLYLRKPVNLRTIREVLAAARI